MIIIIIETRTANGGGTYADVDEALIGISQLIGSALPAPLCAHKSLLFRQLRRD